MVSADLRFPRIALAAAAAAGLLTLAVGLSRVPLNSVTGKTVPGGPAVDWLVTVVAMVAGTAVGTVLAARLLIAILASWVAWLVTQVRAYRRASGEHREQLKWLCGGAVVTVASVLAPGQLVDELISPFGVTALPACIAVAVLKYRLYAIDRIISRVISYAIITAILAGVFAGLVLLATEVLPFKTPVAVAFSTLAAAALFNPLRRRVQHAVDRRFNRARYDAEEVVAAFAGRVRQTVDPGSVTTDLIGAVETAFEPTHISLWLPDRDAR